MLGAVRVNNDEWWMIASISLGSELVGPLAGFVETCVDNTEHWRLFVGASARFSLSHQ